MKYFLSLVFTCNILKLVTTSICYWNSGCPYNYFATITPYNVVRGDIRDSAIKVKACEPHAIWGIFRNGKRYPDNDVAKDMKKSIEIRNYLLSSQADGNCSLCAQDIENLRDWPIDTKIFNKPYSLTTEGYQEMVGIGKRLKEAFPKLLSDLKSGQYTLQPAIDAVTEESAKGFAIGLNRHLSTEKANDDIAAPYRTCAMNQKDLRDDSNILKEVDEYRRNSEYQALKDRMQRRTGIDYILTDEDITSLYNLCRYTSFGFENKLSPWCALFTTSDLQVLEYIEDLYNYYTFGYGTPINEYFGRIPLADLFRSFEGAKNGTGKEIVAYFTKSTMLSMAYSTLGLFKDKEHLKGAHRNPERNWRSSKTTAFSSNLIAVLNRCKNDDVEDYNVVFYLNEEPLRSICGEGICSWQEFEDKLKLFVDTTVEHC